MIRRKNKQAHTVEKRPDPQPPSQKQKRGSMGAEADQKRHRGGAGTFQFLQPAKNHKVICSCRGGGNAGKHRTKTVFTKPTKKEILTSVGGIRRCISLRLGGRCSSWGCTCGGGGAKRRQNSSIRRIPLGKTEVRGKKIWGGAKRKQSPKGKSTAAFYKVPFVPYQVGSLTDGIPTCSSPSKPNCGLPSDGRVWHRVP